MKIHCTEAFLLLNGWFANHQNMSYNVSVFLTFVTFDEVVRLWECGGGMTKLRRKSCKKQEAYTAIVDSASKEEKVANEAK